MVPGGDMIEAELVSENRLARPRLALHNINACLEKAPPQHAVETWDAGGYSLKRRRLAGIASIGSHRSPYVGESGRITVNVDPCAGELVTRISPCIVSTSCRVYQSPMPKPPCSRRVTARSKAPKMRAWSSSDIPMPWSCTVNHISVPWRRTETAIASPAPY